MSGQPIDEQWLDRHEPRLDFPPDLAVEIKEHRPHGTEEVAQPPGKLSDHAKRLATVYALWGVLGYLGVHKFYIGRIKAGVIYIILGVVGIGGWLLLSDWFVGGVISGASILILIGFLLLDLFTLPRQIQKSSPDRKYSSAPGVADQRPVTRGAWTDSYSYLGEEGRGQPGRKVHKPARRRLRR